MAGFLLQVVALGIVAFHNEEASIVEDTAAWEISRMNHLGVTLESGLTAEERNSRYDDFMTEVQNYEDSRRSLGIVAGWSSGLSDIGLVFYTLAPLLMLDVWINAQTGEADGQSRGRGRRR